MLNNKTALRFYVAKVRVELKELRGHATADIQPLFRPK